MAYRVTEAQLQARIDQLNKLTNSPMKPYALRTDGRPGMVAQVGNFHLSHAYGGVCVHRMFNESGGVSTPLVSYHDTKRATFDRLVAFIDGIRFTKEEA